VGFMIDDALIIMKKLESRKLKRIPVDL